MGAEIYKLKLNNNIFSAKGRINETNYFIIMLITTIMAISYLAFVFFKKFQNFNIAFETIMLFVMLVNLYVQVCAIIKRLRDIKYSPWLVLLSFVPILFLVVCIPCLFAKSKWD